MKPKASTMKLFLIISALIMTLIGSLFAVLLGFLLLTTATFFLDKAVFRRVGKLRFWVFSSVVILLAGLVLGKNPVQMFGVSVSVEGFQAGIVMTLRAFTLILGFVQLTTTISQDRFLLFTSKIGLPFYIPAFQTALDTLPQMKKALLDTRTEHKLFSLSGLIDILLLARRMSMDVFPENVLVYGVTGDRKSGKTYFMNGLYRRAVERGVHAGGFIQERFMDQQHNRTGFEVVSPARNQRILLAEKKDGQPYQFNDEAFEKAAAWLGEDAETCRLLLVDEMGLLESQFAGHAPGVYSVMQQHPDKVWVMVLRKDKMENLKQVFNVNSGILDLDKPDAGTDSFSEEILSRCIN